VLRVVDQEVPPAQGEPAESVRFLPEEVPQMERVSKADLLVLDDLGAEKPTEWALEKIYQIVNSRYESLGPMIITTNLDLNSLERLLGERTFGRILEMCVPVEVGGEDHRRRIARLRAEGREM
jgi:DNA replication protein DnaC